MTAAPIAETPAEAAALAAPSQPIGAARIAMWGIGLIIGLPVTVEVSRDFTTIVISLLLGH